MSAGRSPADPRIDSRSGVFLAATLVADDLHRPVRIRNISAKGALVDGAELPTEGIAIDLVRGRLRAHGEVAWRDQSQCGLRSEAQVPVDDWVRMIGHSGQQRVDEMMSLFTRLPCGDPTAVLPIDERDSLSAISGELSELCQQLAGLLDLVARQPGELLRLDAIARRLNSIAAGG